MPAIFRPASGRRDSGGEAASRRPTRDPSRRFRPFCGRLRAQVDRCRIQGVRGSSEHRWSGVSTGTVQRWRMYLRYMRRGWRTPGSRRWLGQVRAAALLGVAVTVASCGSATGRQATTAQTLAVPTDPPAACAASLVRGDVVRAGPFTGPISREHDVVDGRFRLRVGRYRDREAGLTQKIPWFVRPGARVGGSLLIVGERLSPSPRTFRQRLDRTEDSAGQRVFPSIIAPPAEGCWRLRFRSGRSTGRLTVLVRD